MPSLEKFPSFDAAAFARDQAADPFAPGGVFGDGQLKLPWRFPSPYAHALPLGLDANRVPLELDGNARYAMGLPSPRGKYPEDDNDGNDGNDDGAATTTPAPRHQERHARPEGHGAGPGKQLPPYPTPLTPADDGGGRGPGRVVPHPLELAKAHNASPLPSAASRQSDPFVEKDPATRPPPPTPTPTSPAAALRAPTSARLFAGDDGEPGPDVGPAARRRATPPDLRIAGLNGGVAEDPLPSSMPSPLSVSPLSLGRAGSIATVRDLRAMAPPHRQISIRSLAPAGAGAPPEVRDRPIIVTNALNHILYDGPCRHCEVNNCVCLLPSTTTPSPLGAPADAANGDPAALSGTTAPGPQRQPPDNGIMTEGFCRHCVVNHCACVGDAKWGLHHAANALRNARLDEHHPRDAATRRLVSDSGTVHRYELMSTEAEDGDAHRGSSSALRAGSSSPPFTAPLPAHLPPGRERVSRADPYGGFYDLEAQQPRRDGGSSSGRGMVSTFHFCRSYRAGGAGQDSSLRDRRTRRNRLASFAAGHFCRIFVAVIFILLVAVMVWVIWFYTNRDGVPIT